MAVISSWTQDAAHSGRVPLLGDAYRVHTDLREGLQQQSDVRMARAVLAQTPVPSYIRLLCFIALLELLQGLFLET